MEKILSLYSDINISVQSVAIKELKSYCFQPTLTLVVRIFKYVLHVLIAMQHVVIKRLEAVLVNQIYPLVVSMLLIVINKKFVEIIGTF